MYEDEDAEVLKKVKRHSSKKKKDFSSAINSRNLSEEEMDELFLSRIRMARIRRSKTNTTYFMDIPKSGENGKRWKKSDDDEALDVAKD